jgi:hypothetical protein
MRRGNLLKTLVFRYTPFGAPRYPFNIEPVQLAFLVNEIDRLRDVEGSIVEIGVARGMTTRFLCEHIVLRGLAEKSKFYALDTFSSFRPEDLEFEVKQRGKRPGELNAFTYNDFAVWARNFAAFPFVQPIACDCASFDYSTIAPIKLAFLDVDLYKPTAGALPGLFDAIVPGGTLVVDDVLNDYRWDGAYQAFTEFCKARDLPFEIIGNKCGIIRKK